MLRPLSRGDEEAFKLFRHRDKLLTAVRQHSLCDQESQSQSFIFQQCCDTLQEAAACNSVWAGVGDIDSEQINLVLLGSSPSTSHQPSSVQHRLFEFLIQKFNNDLRSFTTPLQLLPGDQLLTELGFESQYCLALPVWYHDQYYGFVVMHWLDKKHISGLTKEFVVHVIEDIALALFSQDTALKLSSERDFNKEIVDTIQALMVTISPCGTILSFNRRAERVTGYKEQEILEKYWVDVLINPSNRLEFQQVFSKTLKAAEANINFVAPLLTKNGKERYISWHGSIRHNIEKGQIGLVMIGIDETEKLSADQQLNMFTARWEKIFVAIQDPVLVVSTDNTIIEANPATCAAAKKRREEVVGRKVCDILHGGHGKGIPCPLEQFIGYQKSQISETELHGLQGTYMLTVTPLLEENGEINATLLVARNLTEEEVVRAEAIRAAQLAAIGELASGVAHEINNPINGIINYAQVILDAPNDPEAEENLNNIISEGKRIAGIVSNLLDFARRKEEVLAPSTIETIVANSLKLVTHLLKKDGIRCTVEMNDLLPSLMCNEQQLQQVVLNMISNARYALNEKYPQPCPEKRLEISGELLDQKQPPAIRLTITDHGIGIPPEIQARLFDPFFSTKPKGEGTGLGLSISHGLVKDHGGTIKVHSNIGDWTRFQIDLPVKPS